MVNNDFFGCSMHYVGYAEMASAVSNAGGLGIITGLTQPDPESLRKEIQKCKKMTDKPFGVNLTILPALIPADYDAYMNVICSERVAVIEITGGSPRKYMKQLKEAGVKVIHKSATIKHALKAQADGVDIIEIAGCEGAIAGRSSKDDTGTWVILAKALNTLTTPVIVSGASATGRQLAAAIAMGAHGITMGTRFLCTKECPIKTSIKERLVESSMSDTTLVLRSFNNSTRVYKNDVAREILRIEEEAQGDFSKIQHLAKGERGRVMFQETGDWNDAMWSCGQSVGLIDDIPTCKELVERLVNEAATHLRKAAACTHSKL
mmetsp:Transcript_23553/g.37516  ORF Transcript_23553/g.37516 Transcript_23553/m.37516 type:complete len:320 (-) Transcript_23553:974-1933(-)